MAKRLSWLVSGGLLLAALALWGSSRLAWIDLQNGHTTNGAAGQSWLLPTAIVSLAGIAAVLALGGVVRRVLGVLLVALGVAVIWLTVVGVDHPLAPSSVRPAPHPVATWPGPTAAIVGGLLLVGVGAVVAVFEKRLARWGASTAETGSSSVTSNTDTDLWKALDEGRDPTDPTSDR